VVGLDGWERGGGYILAAGDHIFTLGNIKAVVEADVIKDFFFFVNV
jgi:hypothetical protein